MTKGEKLIAKGKSMKKREKDGRVILFNTESNIWVYSHEERKIVLVTWESTRKGPMTEITMEEGKFKIIIELLEDKYHEDWYCPKDGEWNRVSNEIEELCQRFEKITMTTEQLMSAFDTETIFRKVMASNKGIREIHFYYGLGLSLGLKRTHTGRVIGLDYVPNRTMRYPASRFDSIL